MRYQLLLVLVPILTTGTYFTAPRIAGHAMSHREAASSFGGYQLLSGSATDAECFPSLECTVSSMAWTCEDNGSNAADCAADQVKLDEVANDFPFGCGVVSPGNECTLAGEYVCATIRGCYLNQYTDLCETDFQNVLGLIQGATSCEDSPGP
jgi:hypothetical protein